MKQLNIHAIQPWKLAYGKMTAPVVVAVEGVHAGSSGPLLWTRIVLERHQKDFDGVPVTMRHPVNAFGQFVSVHFDEFTEQRYIRGKLTDTKYDAREKGIVGRIEILADTQDLSVIQLTRNVSLGVFTKDTESSGSWNGKAYSGIVLDIEAVDHLALLPDERPACAGTGIRNHQKEAEMQEILYLPGVIVLTEKKPVCQSAARAAERHDILLPIEFNRPAVQRKRNMAQNESILLPMGMNK